MPFRVAIHDHYSDRRMPTSLESVLAPLVLAQARL